MIKAIIVDDEKMKSDTLNALIVKNFPEVKILKISTTASEGIKDILALQPELIFLDVKLDNHFTGFDVLEQTSSVKYKVIFTTSYNEYAVKAFDFAAIHYILTPCGVDELNVAITRYKSMLEADSEKSKSTLLQNEKQRHEGPRQILAIPVAGGLDCINVSDIIFCKAVNTYTEFYLTNFRKLTATRTLKSVEKQMEEQGHRFQRVHDSYLINLNHVKKYRKGGEASEKGEGGFVEMTDQMEAPVSRRRRDELLNNLS